MRRKRRTFTPEQLAERAGERYDRLWTRTRDAFGADAYDSPNVRFNTGKYSWTTPADNAVNLSDKRTRQLARLGKPVLSQHERRTLSRPKKIHMRRKRKIKRNDAKRLVAHEWAHVYQDRDYLREVARDSGLPLEALVEGGAENFAKRLTRRRFGRSNRGNTGGSYDAYQREVRKLGNRHMNRRQFGARYGMDPKEFE